MQTELKLTVANDIGSVSCASHLHNWINLQFPSQHSSFELQMMSERNVMQLHYKENIIAASIQVRQLVLGPSKWYSCFWSSARINNYALRNFSNSTSAHAQYDGFTVSCESISISLSKLK